MQSGLVTASVVITLASTAYTAYSMNEAAEEAEQMANYNAEMQRQNNELNFRIAQQNNDYQRKLLEINQAQSANDAAMIEAQRVTNFDQTREQIRRVREEKEAMLQRQRAGYAAAGVLTSGSPIEVLADTAGIYELQAQDTLYQGELADRELAYRADVFRQGADVEKFKENLITIDDYSARTAQRLGLQQTELNRLSGISQANGMRAQAVGTLLSGVASTTGTVAQGYQKGAFTRKTPNAGAVKGYGYSSSSGYYRTGGPIT